MRYNSASISFGLSNKHGIHYRRNMTSAATKPKTGHCYVGWQSGSFAIYAG